jgi:hypothetical protein
MANQYKRHLKQVQQRARAVEFFFVLPVYAFRKFISSTVCSWNRFKTEEKHFSCNQKFYGVP